ncbi:MAG TPA: hypothetical protein VFI15_07805 [Candidatus Limnocylindrales bacterium]|nr:hypothetical protein [Candidatus Limnocylindrales bacterium]
MSGVVAAVLTMTVAQLLDLATFGEMVHRVGAQAEGNPLVAAMFEMGGMPAVAIAKVALTAIVAAVVAWLANRPSSRLATALVVVVVGAGILAGLIGGATNTAAIGLL